MRRRIGGGAGGDEEENEINLTPMLDVVFIMLIFFIVPASFIKESGLDVSRPEASTALKGEDATRSRTTRPCEACSTPPRRPRSKTCHWRRRRRSAASQSRTAPQGAEVAR